MKDIVVCKIAALTVRNRKPENGSRPRGISKGTVMTFDADVNVLTNEMQAAIAHKRAGKQSRFAENLKAVANANDQSSLSGKDFHRAHDGREACNGSAAQVVPVRESAWDDDRVKALQRGVLVPDVFGRCAREGVERVNAVLIAV